jgi:cytidylate kinase
MLNDAKSCIVLAGALATTLTQKILSSRTYLFSWEDHMMQWDPKIISEMRAITISREYGSGGGEIATRVAHRLGWQLIDHEVVVRVAQELGVSEAEAAEQDEQAESLLTRVLTSLQVIQPSMLVTVPVTLTTDSHAYRQARQRVVQGAFATGHVVIVGRGAQVLLAQNRDALHVRIVAPLAERIAYVMQREGLDQEIARARIQLKDRDRTRFLQVEHHEHPQDAHLYDLVVNTGVLDLESVVDLLILALEHKARRLSTPTEALGPGVGLPQYPRHPDDFRSPKSTNDPPT